MHRLDHFADLLFGANARRIKAIGPRLGVGYEPGDDILQVARTDEETLAASDQHHIAAAGIDRGARRADAFGREFDVVKRLRLVAGGILDRQAGHASRNAASDVCRDLVRFIRKAAFEIGVHRQIGRCA